jgi:predicted RNA-binding Zn-ribbon protein involved in translation (DUF1610 family)
MKVMRLPWLAREYERTCDDCGWSWRVPRRLARRRVQSISGFGVTSGGIQTAADRAELKAEVQSSMELSEQAEAFRECPKCGSVRYKQRRARS